jgi:type IV pilus assembly protein PilF
MNIAGRSVFVRIFRVIVVVLAAGSLPTACVTESSGGLPKPAPKAERADAQLAVARGYIGAASWANAKRALDKAIALDSTLPEAWVLYAVVYEAEGELELAENHYRKALRLSAVDPQALFNYGNFLYRRGRFDDAAEVLAKVAKNTEYRARPQAYEALGLAEVARGRTAAAAAAFERALSLNDQLAPSQLELAWMDFDNNDLQGAVRRYERYRSISKPTARSLCLGMKIGVAVGNSDQVASNALALKNLFPTSREAKSCQVQSQ